MTGHGGTDVLQTLLQGQGLSVLGQVIGSSHCINRFSLKLRDNLQVLSFNLLQ